MGILGSRQRDLAERMKENLEHVSRSVDELILLTKNLEPPSRVNQYIDVQRAIESAINNLSGQLSEKNLLLDLAHI